VIDLKHSAVGSMLNLRSDRASWWLVARRRARDRGRSHGGDVIRAINGQPLNIRSNCGRSLAGLKPGDAVVLEVERQSVLQYVAFEME
jgi:S1-C subfamily serine protease